MLNSYYNEQRLEINATSGILTKTYRDSFMVNFHYNSQAANKLFSKEPTLTKRSKEEAVVIIQTLIQQFQNGNKFKKKLYQDNTLEWER